MSLPVKIGLLAAATALCVSVGGVVGLIALLGSAYADPFHVPFLIALFNASRGLFRCLGNSEAAYLQKRAGTRPNERWASCIRHLRGGCICTRRASAGSDGDSFQLPWPVCCRVPGYGVAGHYRGLRRWNTRRAHSWVICLTNRTITIQPLGSPPDAAKAAPLSSDVKTQSVLVLATTQ